VATLILSPHFDDAILSCWHLLDGKSEVGVINVFGGVPPADADGWWDRASGMGSSAAVVELRRAEDEAALALAGRHAITLDFLDYQYRDVSQPVEPVLERLRSLLAPGTHVWAPAALPPLGEPEPGYVAAAFEPHPDHSVVRCAALALHAEGWAVTLYADLPHASARGLPGWVTGEPNGAGPVAAERWRRCLASARADDAEAAVHRLSGRAWARKLEAVRRYSSQIAPLERGFGRAIDAPELLDYEVAWRLR
jgi:hypothetical protein